MITPTRWMGREVAALFVALSIATSFGVGVAASQPPTPASRAQGEAPQAKPDTKGDNAGVAPLTTAKPVVRSEPPVTAPPKQQPNDNANQFNTPSNERGWDVPSIVNAVSSGVIALVTIGLFIVAGKQQEVTEKQRAIMEKQRELMEGQNKIMETQNRLMEISQRAWLSITDTQLSNFKPGGFPNLVFTLKNDGRVPATINAWTLQVFINVDLPPRTMDNGPHFNETSGVITQSQHGVFEIAADNSRGLTEEDFLTLRDGPARMRFSGAIRYETGFGVGEVGFGIEYNPYAGAEAHKRFFVVNVPGHNYSR